MCYLTVTLVPKLVLESGPWVLLARVTGGPNEPGTIPVDTRCISVSINNTHCSLPKYPAMDDKLDGHPITFRVISYVAIVEVHQVKAADIKGIL